MRWSTAAAVGIFVVSAASCAYSMTVVNNNLDLGVPEITMDVDSIEMSIHDDPDVILAGITASDSRDGDVTDSLEVENLSNFIEKGVRKASIIAFDSANHVSRTYREVRYTDYTSPQFVLEAPLRFNRETSDYVGILQAQDCLDGDITNKIHMTLEEEPTEEQQEIRVTYSVSNSLGDTVTIPATVSLYDPYTESAGPVITLTDYLIYVEKDEKVNPMLYLTRISMSGRQYKRRNGKMTLLGLAPDAEPEILPEEQLEIEKGEPKNGVYEISYTVHDFKDETDKSDDVSKTVRLIVVVKE